MRDDGEKVVTRANRVTQFNDQLLTRIQSRESASVRSLWTGFLSAPGFESEEGSSEVSLGFFAITLACTGRIRCKR